MSLSVKSSSFPIVQLWILVHYTCILLPPNQPCHICASTEIHCCLTQCAFIFNTLTVVECRHAKSKRDTRKPPPCSTTSHHPIHGCVGESSVEVVG